MKRNRFIISFAILLLLFGSNVYAERIPQNKALEIASSFFKKAGHLQQNIAVLRTSEDLPSLATKSNSEQPWFYVIGNENGTGYVIVSADDRFCPILGYSLENDFIQEIDIPSNVEGWFIYLRNQMAWAEENGITDQEATSAWKKEMEVAVPVKNLNTALWGQEAPFYNQCPMDGVKRSLTGCVATAVCEVMRYHKWPTKGKGMTTSYTGESKVKVEARDLNHNYYWDKMPLNISEYDTDEKRNAVATLMADLGAALQLDYSSDGTGGVPGQPALFEKFGYSSAAHYDYRINYTDDEWLSMVKNEIDNNRPIIYDGQDSSNGGHCFVIDGYDNQNYVHVNWGWNGGYNGYFLISALNPSKYKFNSDQDAIFGFEPGNWEMKNPEHWLDLYTPGLGCEEILFSKGKQFKIAPFMYTNTSIMDFNGEIALIMIDKAGNPIDTIFQKTDDFPAGKYMYSGYSSVTVQISKDIKPGYRIRAFYKPASADEWSPMWRDGAANSITQEILVANDTDDTLERSTSFYYDRSSNKITISTKLEGVEATLYDENDNVITEGTSFECPVFVIDMKKLSEGKYRIKLGKGNEIKNLSFSVTAIK